MPMQIRRTATPNNPPTGLAAGQLSVEMASSPARLWCGVPTSIDASGRIAIGGGAVAAHSLVAPANPRVGELWFDPESLVLFVWYNDGNSTQWVPTINQGLPDLSIYALRSELLGNPVHYGPTAPGGPNIGDLWFDTSTGDLKVWQAGAWSVTTQPATGFLPLAGGTVTGQVGILQNLNVWGTTSLRNNVGVFGELGIGDTNGALYGFYLRGDALGSTINYMADYFDYFSRGTGGRSWKSGPYGYPMVCDAIGNMIIGGTLTQNSDRRLKGDIHPAAHGLAEIIRLQPVTFIRSEERRVEAGFIAQDVQEVLPEAVRAMLLPDIEGPEAVGRMADEPLLGITYSAITAALVKAVQELAQRLATVEAR